MDPPPSSKKGQAANEAALIIGIMILFLIVFLAGLSEIVFDASEERSRDLVRDLGDVIEAELTLAVNAQDGYSRMFILPSTLNGLSYTLLFYNKSNTNANFTQLVITAAIGGVQFQETRLLPDNILGDLTTGRNSIRKEAGLVNLTSLPPTPR